MNGSTISLMRLSGNNFGNSPPWLNAKNTIAKLSLGHFRVQAWAINTKYWKRRGRNRVADKEVGGRSRKELIKLPPNELRFSAFLMGSHPPQTLLPNGRQIVGHLLPRGNFASTLYCTCMLSVITK